MIKTLVPAALAIALIATPALAAKTEMTCRNPGRSYLVTFDDAARTFHASAPGARTAYTVEQVEQGENGIVVRGKTVKGGPDFVAHLGGEKRMEFVIDGQVIQTDMCN